jgi:esterase
MVASSKAKASCSKDLEKIAESQLASKESLMAVAAIPLSPNEMNYQFYGDEKAPVLILIHGVGGSINSFNNVIPALSKKYRILVYEQRGHGLTGAVGDNYYSRTMANDLDNLLNNLGIKKAIVLGHSMGGRTALRFAQLHPEKTRAVIIEDMHPKGRSGGMPERRIMAQEILSKLPLKFRNATELLKKLRKAVNSSEGEVQKIFLSTLRGVLFGKLKIITLPNGEGIAFQFHPATNELYWNQGLEEDLTDALAQAASPILFLRADDRNVEQSGAVLFGKGVEIIEKQNALRSQNGLSPAQIIMIPHSGHGIHSSQPEEFIQTVTSFLATLHN